MRRRLLAGALMVLAWGCGDGHAPGGRPPAGPSSAPSAEPSSPGAADAGTSSVYDGIRKLDVVLDDPRLAVARDRQQARDLSAAAREMDRVRAGVALDAERACAWAFVAGRLHSAAGEATEATLAFERAISPGEDAGSQCPLAPYASLRIAQALVRLGRYDEASARARAVGDEVAFRDEARLALADAQIGKGERALAIPIWRALLAAGPQGPRWVDLSMQLATALLDGAAGPPRSNGQEALELATRVLVEAPMAAEKVDVIGLRTRAAAVLTHRAAPPLTPDERARQAQAWLDASQPKRARETAEALLKALPNGSKQHRDAACKAAIVVAQAMPRGKADEVADAWGVAIVRCDDDEALVSALYYGGKASASAHRSAEALSRFGKVEKLFPAHRFADDARLRAASVVYDDGDEARYLALLSTLPDAYPDGDMRGEALFRVALAKLGKGDVDGARTALDRALTIIPDDHAWGTAGRIAYFRARVSQTMGEVDDAKTRYAALIGDQPLAYYMLLAYARLRAMDDTMARSSLEAAIVREPPGPFLSSRHSELASPAFDHFARLLEVGEVAAARQEAHAGGLLAEGVDPEVLWTMSWLYDQAGAPDLGHAFARTRLLDFRGHWPAGRWKLAWEAAYPRAWDAVVARESDSAGIPAPLTWAIMREESAFNPDAHSAASAIGLMQLLTGTARQIARGTQILPDEGSLYHPEVSIALGSRLLSSLRKSFATNPALAIAAYNAGPGAVRRWLAEPSTDEFDLFVERIPFDETRGYVKRVLASEAAYAYLYAPKTLDELLALPLRASP